MDKEISFTVVIPPVGQMRARTKAFRMGNVVTSRAHKDPKQAGEEEKLLALLYEHKPAAPFKGPIHLIARVYLPIPKSKGRKWKADALAGIILPTVKPDCSNLIKHLEDVMNGVFFEDDKQIVRENVEKYYGDPARWEITIRAIGHGD
jgi:Holliday junction resolvase RusA-like endonuclease